MDLKSGFERLVLPGIVLQSVLIGGGYATGREVVQFGGRHGAAGVLGVFVILAGFTLVSIAVFEFARWARAYDYKTFVRGLIGEGWRVFDAVFLGMVLLVLAVMASASGEILNTTLGVPYMVGILTVVVAAGVLLFWGDRVIEVFKSAGSLVLYAGFALFGVAVLARTLPDALAVLADGATTTGAVSATGSGVLYVGYNLVAFPAVLFTLHRQATRRDTVVAGVVAGVLMTAPFALTYLALMGSYPDPAVLDAAVPWLPMLASAGGSVLVGLYGVVVGWTLLETSVGLLHAFIDRLGHGDERAGDTRRPSMRNLGIGLGVLVGAVLLAQVGIIELIATGYTVMAYAFLALFGLPLLTVGMYKAVLGAPVSRLVVFDEVDVDARVP